MFMLFHPGAPPSSLNRNPYLSSPRILPRQDACQNSPNATPSSPTRQTDSFRAGYGYPSQPRLVNSTLLFLDHATRPIRDSMRDQDDGDPHDLSFPTRHFPRPSMVENMVMSLDQFPVSTDTSRTHRSRSASARHQGHIKSSSSATETDLKKPTVHEIPAFETSSTYDASRILQVEEVPHIFGEEEETRREKAYNAQRAMQGSRPSSLKANIRARSTGDSASSSIDLGHLATYNGRLGPAGNRRSQSFDFGASRPKPITDISDPTPSPRLPQGADILNAISANSVTTQSIVRKNSGRSIKGGHRKVRSGTITANTTSKPRMESPQPQLMTKSQTLDAVDAKANPTPQTDPNLTPRAGFFRRVFGSSSRGSTAPSSYPSPIRHSLDRGGSAIDLRRPPTPPAKQSKATGADVSQNKENQPMLTKKSSSFFRRRKKSMSGGVPPPLPLTLNNNFDAKLEAGASSPVSSLRAFMDPYLGDGVPKHTRGSSLQSVQHADDITVKDQPIAAADPKTPLQKLDTNTAGLGIVSGATQPSVKGKNQIESGRHGQDFGPVKPSQVRMPSSTSFVSTRVGNETSEELKKLDSASDDRRKVNIGGSTEDNNSPVRPNMTTHRSTQDGQSALSMIKLVPKSSGSDISDYKSAPSTPMVADIPDRKSSKPFAVHVSHPSISQTFAEDDISKARKIHENIDEQVDFSNACAWLGEASAERERIRAAYMSLFDWTRMSILAALRNLCSKLILKGETQQVDRVLDAFAQRWCHCNVNHGFKSTDVVHTICYSILLLNTDLHLADIGRKMTKAEFTRNALDTVRENVAETENEANGSTGYLAAKTTSHASSGPSSYTLTDRAASSMSTTRPAEHLTREESYDDSNTNTSERLVDIPFVGSQSGWELQVDMVLKEFYSSISREPLPLFGSHAMSRPTPQQSANNLSALSTLRRTPSTISKATSDSRGRYAGESRSLGARWTSKGRSRQRLGTAQAFGSSRTSVDDQSSAWSPSMSSTWSKVSLNKTLTSMSVDSFNTDHLGSGGYQSSIGFANALSQAIIRDEQMESDMDEGIKAVPLLEDESLELYGAPWAKEGILKHKCHLEGVDKRSKDRNWNDCFAVIEKGWMRLFSFSMTAKSLRNKARNHKAGAVVGGGNWQDNAEEVWKFMLRHTIASSLPPPGYSKQRPYVWALSLPNGAVHLFSVGTPDIVKEFVTTANFWSARLSKEPMTGGISSTEYGWSDSVVNRALAHSDSHPGFGTTSPRPSTQLSMRSSMDHGNFRARLPGDKAHISEWVPPQQSLMASQLLEIDQMKALQAYVKNIEDELQKHNELRGPMLLAFTSRHPNGQKAMSNWEKKSSYLLREIVKFRTYIDALQSAHSARAKVDKMKREEALNQRIEVD